MEEGAGSHVRRQWGPGGAWHAAGSPRWAAAELTVTSSTSFPRWLWPRRSYLLSKQAPSFIPMQSVPFPSFDSFPGSVLKS